MSETTERDTTAPAETVEVAEVIEPRCVPLFLKVAYNVSPNSLHLRHSFYESDEKLTLDIFDKGANPEEVVVKFEPRSVCPSFQSCGASTQLVIYASPSSVHL